MGKILLGIDIGRQVIKAVQISREKQFSLLAAGYVATPTQALLSNTPADDQVIADTINRLVHDMKVSTTEVSASLPSSKVITRIIEVPLMSEKELMESLSWEAEQYIPLPLSKVKMDYAILEENKEENKMKILLVAAPIAVVERYMKFFSLAGLNPVSFETEILADARSVSMSFPALTNLLILNFGAGSTEIGLLHESILVYSKSYPVGGNTLTRTLAEEMGFELAQAEEYKKAYGLDEEKLEGKVAKSLLPVFSGVFEEIEKTIAYFREQYPNEELKGAILCGGGAKLPGLVLSVTKQFGFDSQINNPFLNLVVDPNILPVLASDAPIYTTAIGLALKETD